MKKFKNKYLTASSKNWIARQFSDPYTKLAKQKGYRSRSAFKLIEINDKFKFLKNNLNILWIYLNRFCTYIYVLIKGVYFCYEIGY
ncbi:MAG: hypothetical protein RL305_584 [Pseudomonadota bacterium]